MAEALGRDAHTISRWAVAFAEGGPSALVFEQTGGSPALVNSTSPRRGQKTSYHSAVCLETGEVDAMSCLSSIGSNCPSLPDRELVKKAARARRYAFWASVNRASLRGVVMTRRCSRGKNKPRQQAQLEAERMTRKSELIVGESPTTITEIWLTLAPRRLRMAVQRHGGRPQPTRPGTHPGLSPCALGISQDGLRNSRGCPTWAS